MPEILRIATAVVGLVLAAWAGYIAWRDRAPTRGLFFGTIALEVLAIALVVTAFAGVGHRGNKSGTFIGYVVAFLIIPPAGFTLAKMEATKWGSVIIAVAGIVEAILVVRLQQVFTGVG